MLSMVRMTRSDTNRQIFVPADSIQRVEPNGEPNEPGCTVITTCGQFKCVEAAIAIVGAVNHAVEWKETRVVQGQLDAAAQLQEKQQGLVIARPHLNGN